MKSNRPIATIVLILLSITLTIIAPIFDKSIYGVNAHPTEWMSFAPALPFRHGGIGWIMSLFLHLNVQHLIINMVLLSPVAMMIERKKSGIYLASNFFALHILVLMSLIAVNTVYPLTGKAFLGSSHVIVGLYSFWGLLNKKYSMIFFALLILAAGLWQSQSPLTILAHSLGFFAGMILLIFGRLGRKIGLQRSH